MLKRYAPLWEIGKKPPVMGAGFIFVLIVLSVIISTHSLLALFSLEGLLIVGGGVVAVAYMSYGTEDVRRALEAIQNVFEQPRDPNKYLQQDMMKIVAWASVIKEKGMRSLEKTLSKSGIDDPFVKYGLNMVVSEYTPDDVRTMMETAADACYERDSFPVEILHDMASHAPAFGMVGTLVGMVAMLYNMNDGVTGMGANLAVSFLSTLYGVLSARMLYLPAATRLKQEVDARRFRNHLIIEGMALLVGNKSPMYIQDRLNSFLRPESHDYFDYFTPSTKQPEKIIPASKVRLTPAKSLKVANA